MQYISTAECAELKGCTSRYIQQQIKCGKIQAEETPNAANNRKEYLIPVSSLDETLQRRYYNQVRQEMGLRPEEKTTPKPKQKQARNSLDEFSAAERNLMSLWVSILKEWRTFREGSSNKTKIDELFVSKVKLEHPELEVSVATIYKKYRAYQNNDLEGLVDNRGGWNKGQCGIPKHILDAFLYYYLDERQLAISYCVDLTKTWTGEFYPEDYPLIPSERTFRRQAEKLPEAVVALCRKGEKEMKDKYIPYVERLYEELEANDAWVADNHTFDFITAGENGKQHRLYLTAFLDAKSGVIVGYNITDNPSSQSTLLALRDGMLKFGIPNAIYVDNGSEFLTHDIGGRGHRKKADWNKCEIPPTILQMLDIKMYNAMVRNAKAKPIERTFFTIKEHVSKVIETFCGGTILERPESLKYLLKHGEIPTDQKIRNIFETLINGGFNMDMYGGKERRYKNKRRIDVWNESIQNTAFRKASADDLALLLARTTRYQKISRNGVWVTIKGEKLWYSRDEMWRHIGEMVYVRYDPSDYQQVRVYSAEDDKYMFNCVLATDQFVDYLTADPEDVAAAERNRRAVERSITQAAKGLTDGVQGDQRIDFLSTALIRAENRQKDFEIIQPTKFIPVMSDSVVRENPQLEGIVEVEIDMRFLNDNAEKRKRC